MLVLVPYHSNRTSTRIGTGGHAWPHDFGWSVLAFEHLVRCSEEGWKIESHANDEDLTCKVSEESWGSPLKTLLGIFEMWIKNLWFWSSRDEDLGINKRSSAPLKSNPCFAGTIYTGKQELKNKLWLRSLKQKFQERVSSKSLHRSCVLEVAKGYPVLSAKLV